MILNCPSCGTLYRHVAVPAGVAARCSRCSETFAIPAPRRYRVAPSEAAVAVLPALWAATAGPASLAHPVGADDPTLTLRLERMASERGFPPLPARPEPGPSQRPLPSVNLDRMIEEIAGPRTVPVAVPLAAAIVGAGATFGASAWIGGTLGPAAAGMGAGAIAGWVAWRWADTKR